MLAKLGIELSHCTEYSHTGEAGGTLVPVALLSVCGLYVTMLGYLGTKYIV